MKTLSAICVTSEGVKRQQIRFTETITEIGDLRIPDDQLDYYYDDSCLLFAGMGDVHIHAREDVSGKNCYKEDFKSAQEAMMNGGVTHAGDMPNNPVPPIDDASYEAKFRLASEKTQGMIWPYAGIGPATRPLSYKVPYKVYMGPSVGDLFFKDLRALDETLSHYRGQWVSFHCEDPEVLDEHTQERHHHHQRPVKAEVVATRDALHLIEKYDLKAKLCHYSTSEGLALIREARKKGLNVSIEVTPQHLYFDMDHLNEAAYRPLQMNPPIRYEVDRKTLFEALKNGEIQYLATDHAPHTEEEKSHGHSGLTGLDTFGPFVTWLLHEGLDPEVIAKVTAENPGDFFNEFLPTWKKLFPAYAGYGKGLGYLRPEYRANFTILQMDWPMTVTKEKLKTKAGHSPFLGTIFPGMVEAVFIGGMKK